MGESASPCHLAIFARDSERERKEGFLRGKKRRRRRENRQVARLSISGEGKERERESIFAVRPGLPRREFFRRTQVTLPAVMGSPCQGVFT